MSANSAFDYAIPYDIMVGYWVGTASIYSPKGVYAMSTKSYVSVYWEERHTNTQFPGSPRRTITNLSGRPGGLPRSAAAEDSDSGSFGQPKRRLSRPITPCASLQFDLDG